jgi:hypothetical protein
MQLDNIIYSLNVIQMYVKRKYFALIRMQGLTEPTEGPQ